MERPPRRAATALEALTRHYGPLAPARLEQLRDLAARCFGLWAANPGLTGWTMRRGRAGANLAALLVEEHLQRLAGSVA